MAFFVVLGCSVPPGAPPCCNVFATVLQARVESPWQTVGWVIARASFFFLKPAGLMLFGNLVETFSTSRLQ